MKVAPHLDDELGAALRSYAERIPAAPDVARLHAAIDAAPVRMASPRSSHRLVTAGAAAGIALLAIGGALALAAEGSGESEEPIVRVTEVETATTPAPLTSPPSRPTTVATSVAPPSTLPPTTLPASTAAVPAQAVPPAAPAVPVVAPPSDPPTTAHQPRRRSPATTAHRPAPSVVPVTVAPTTPPPPTPPTTAPPVTHPPTTHPAPTQPPTTHPAPTQPPTTHPPTTAPPPEDIAFTATAAFGFCADDEAFDVYSGTAAPGSTVTITSAYGGGTTTADEEGHWEHRVVFTGAPRHQPFEVTVTSGQESRTFTFTHTG